VQLGFVIDHTRCIGCHACTVACKSENQVPVGNFRTWVKYTEGGTFPSVRRGFSVLRCNQCTEAPCIEICPVTALSKHENGIVDVDPSVCIGCKGCTHACPYDAIYINEESGIAEKCHFCEHRTERGLAPACAVVCPTEAIIPGDFHDPESRVSQLKRDGDLTVRKPEAGTVPNVLYIGVDSAGIDPGETNLSQGFIWSEPPSGEREAAQRFEAEHSSETARTTYDVPRSHIWGWRVSAYLWTKSISAGVLPVAFLALAMGAQDAPLEAEFSRLIAAVVSLVFLGITGLLLVADLKRPERFLYIFLRPNWDSWLVRGSFIILGYNAVLVACLFVGSWLLEFAAYFLGGWTAAYTAYLFGQAKGRVLWMRQGLGVHLVIQAGIAGASMLLLMDALGVALDPGLVASLPKILTVCLVGHLVAALLESRMAPKGREEEYARAARLISHGPYARMHWGAGVVLGILLPLTILAGASALLPAAAILALVGLLIEEDLFVRAGQALPIS
jgi:Fe-S-cluster-containing dehydrogenase component/predicted membrane protein